MAITKATASSVAPAAKGDLVVGSGTNDAAVLAVGSANQVLTVDSSTGTGLKWATPSASFTATTHTLTFAPFGFTEGNSTKSSYYVDMGDIFLFAGYVKVGSTAVAGTLRVVPPFNIRSTNPTPVLGSLNIFYDASASKSYLVQPLYQGTDKIGFDYVTANTTYTERAGELNAVITLATDDELYFQVICRKA